MDSMEELPPADEKRRSRIRIRAVLVGAFGVAVFTVLGLAALEAHKKAKRTREMAEGLSNMNNIKNAILTYTADGNDRFMDANFPNQDPGPPKNSNEAFRILIKHGYINSEECFTFPGRAAHADGDISSSEKILGPGENLYAMAKGLASTSNASYPVVWEASLEGEWDPVWDSSLPEDSWGSTRDDGTVLVLTVGGSISLERIQVSGPSKDGKGKGRLAPRHGPSKNMFQIRRAEQGALLPVRPK